MVYERSPAYRPGQKEPYPLSRSKIDLFMQCPRCFWLEVREKIKRPSGPPFSINNAIDLLLKKEFDSHRKTQTKHPLFIEYELDVLPFQHEKMDEWRDALRRGVKFLHPETNLLLRGGIDDAWVDPSGTIYVVDYKATAKVSEVSLDADWQNTYKRQMEIYQWLLRQNGFNVSDTGYFVYTNGRLDLDGFNDRVEFMTKIIPYTGDDGWVDGAIVKMKKCMDGGLPKVGNQVMNPNEPCEYCSYAEQRAGLTLDHMDRNKISAKDALKKLRR